MIIPEQFWNLEEKSLTITIENTSDFYGNMQILLILKDI